MVVKAAIGQCWRWVGARLEPRPVQPSGRTADPNSMDGADMWAKTWAQLMAQTEAQDTWELAPQENRASGPLHSSAFQYRLRGLSRCGWGPPVASQELGWGVKLPRHQPVLDVAWALGGRSGRVSAWPCHPTGGWAGRELPVPSGQWGSWGSCVSVTCSAGEPSPCLLGTSRPVRGPAQGRLAGGGMAARLWQTLFTTASPRFHGSANSWRRVGLCPALQRA